MIGLDDSGGISQSGLPPFELIAVTFIKCERDYAEPFSNHFAGSWLDEIWVDKAGHHAVKPIILAASAGYFDFIIVMRATSTPVVSEFCNSVLRAKGWAMLNGQDIRALGEYVLDTQTTISLEKLKSGKPQEVSGVNS